MTTHDSRFDEAMAVLEAELRLRGLSLEDFANAHATTGPALVRAALYTPVEDWSEPVHALGEELGISPQSLASLAA